MGRPFTYVDPAVLAGLATFIRGRTDALVLVGDGTDHYTPVQAAQAHGHLAIIEQAGFQFVDLHLAPYTRFNVPHPAMFRGYELSSELEDIDLFISLAKLKAHHLCGVTLSMKNLFGLPPGPIWGSPRGSLHSPVRLPRVLADLTQLFPPGICLIDGLIGCNYAEWHGQGGDPVASGVLIAGDNPVATDATAARFMGVDPEARRGMTPFLRADNHVRLASEMGLGPVKSVDIDLIGDMPVGRKPFTIEGASEPETFPEMEKQRQEACRLARWYFDERDHFGNQYLDQSIVLGHDKVLMHHPLGEQVDVSEFFSALRSEGVEFYETFVKLVRAEEDELREPYALHA